jgi:phenylalanyl-tRNA synthetase beta chain
VRVPLSWLQELTPLTQAPVEIAAAMVRAGLEVEKVEQSEVSGVVVGRVLDIEDLTGLKKPIRYCHVDVGSRVHEVVCGATNFAVGDLVPFAVPGASLPGGFQIATRKTYGRTSDGMICSESELGIGEGSAGILVLPPDLELGADVVAALGLDDVVFDFAVTPDRGYLLSLRGVARELATAFGLPFTDPGLATPTTTTPGYDVQLADPGCDRYVALTVTGLDPTVESPTWLKRRLTQCGMRPISLAVDVTNHVLLELGQPLHAFDLDRLQGPIVVRRARAEERLVTLDGQDRALHPEDLVITDDSGPIALAGVMGGASTEVTEATQRILVESAHFDPRSITRTARRHRLPSEASKRFERGVDPLLGPVAAAAAARLLASIAGAQEGPVTDVDGTSSPAPLVFDLDRPGRVAGRSYPPETVTARLRDVGCEVEGDGPALVTPPPWRPDLTGHAELVEEVIRLEGYDTVPVALPTAPAGRGLSEAQRIRRTASRSLAAMGLVEVVMPPFVAAGVLTALGLDGLDAPVMLNPLSEQEAHLRPSLLPGLLSALQRNVGRGLHDVGLFETGSVFRGNGTPAPEVPKTSQRPTDQQLAALDAALPTQPQLAGLVLAGRRGGRPVAVGDAVEILLGLGRALGLALTVRRGESEPFHPGRCAQLLLGEQAVAVVGELHPRVTEALSLPARCVAGEVDLGELTAAAVRRGPATAPRISVYPPSSVDVALVVGADVLAGEVETALRSGAGPLLEAISLFDVYTGPQVGEGATSLAFTLRFRAADRTLTDAEVLQARDAAVARAAAAHGATLRG